MTTTRPAKLSPLAAMMAFEIASAPIARQLKQAEADSARALEQISRAATAKRNASTAAQGARADRRIEIASSKYQAANDAVFALQERLIALEKSIPGLPSVDAQTQGIASDRAA